MFLNFIRMPVKDNVYYDIEKNISSSLHAIKYLKDDKAYKVDLENFPIHNCMASSGITENDEFIVKIFIDKYSGNPFERKMDKFGTKKNIIFIHNGRKYFMKENSYKTISTTVSDPTIITFEAGNFQDREDEYFENKRLRLIIPTNVEPEFDLFQSKRLHIAGTTYFSGLLEVKINNKNYHIFKHKNDDSKESFLIVDSLEENTFDEFKKYTSAIILSYGFITGKLFQDEYYYQVLRCQDDYIHIDSTAYFKKEASIINGAEIFSPIEFEQYLDYFKKKHLFDLEKLRLSPIIFSNICEKVLNNVPLSRSIKLILEATQTKLLLLKAGILSIALETITGFVSDENEKKMKPIADKKLSKKIIEKFKEVVNEYESFISDYGKNILTSKIDNINSPTNSKKLSKPFEIYNLKLSKTELEILNHRNKFLHGTSPFEEEDLQNKDSDIAFISKKLLTLCNSLILKYCGYSGHTIDYSGYHQLRWENKVTEHLFKII